MFYVNGSEEGTKSSWALLSLCHTLPYLRISDLLEMSTQDLYGSELSLSKLYIMIFFNFITCTVHLLFFLAITNKCTVTL
jgi:hypothetical protein